jgi:hypothetical protein
MKNQKGIESIGFLLLMILLMTAMVLSITGCTTDAAGRTESISTQSLLVTEEGRLLPVEVEGVIDFSRSEYAELWNNSPVDGKPLFFAAVPRMANRDNEYEKCIDMAAVQAARFASSRVVAKFAVVSEGRQFGTLEEVDVYFDAESARTFRDQLLPVQYYRDREASYMVLEYNEAVLAPAKIDSKLQNGLPVWITSPPEVPGYITAIGASGRYRLVADSIYQADKMALAGIARQLSIGVQAKQEHYEASSSSTSHREVGLEITDVALRGAYIAARWRTVDGNNYYSLAVYPGGNT